MTHLLESIARSIQQQAAIASRDWLYRQAWRDFRFCVSLVSVVFAVGLPVVLVAVNPGRYYLGLVLLMGVLAAAAVLSFASAYWLRAQENERIIARIGQQFGVVRHRGESLAQFQARINLAIDLATAPEIKS